MQFFKNSFKVFLPELQKGQEEYVFRFGLDRVHSWRELLRVDWAHFLSGSLSSRPPSAVLIRGNSGALEISYPK